MVRLEMHRTPLTQPPLEVKDEIGMLFFRVHRDTNIVGELQTTPTKGFRARSAEVSPFAFRLPRMFRSGAPAFAFFGCKMRITRT